MYSKNKKNKSLIETGKKLPPNTYYTHGNIPIERTPPGVKPTFLPQKPPLYPKNKMSWEDFKEQEKITQNITGDYLNHVYSLSTKGLLNLDLDSIKGTPEHDKVNRLIKEVERVFRSRYTEFTYDYSYKMIKIIAVILSYLAAIGIPLVSKMMEDNKNKQNESNAKQSVELLKKNNPKQYVQLLKKNKELRTIVSKKPKETDKPEKIIKWGLSIIDLIQK